MINSSTHNYAAQDWSPQFLQRYSKPLPRYTSYPGAQHFSESFLREDYENALMAAAAARLSVGLYLHLPFCRDICYYCSCNKIVTRDPAAIRRYLNALKAEIKLLADYFPAPVPVSCLHLGGGTPTALSAGELTELVFELSRHFALQDDDKRDFSIEIDPRTVDADSLGLFKGLGFNRVSFGVQDFDPAVQGAVNRIQPYERVAELVTAVRSFGFKSLNFDLIYGLPKQDKASMQKTLDRVVELAPDRIALYNYAHLPDRFPSQRAIDRYALPTADEKINLLSLAAGRLQQAGYHYIGMDHFVREGDELHRAAQQGKLLRNFQGYAIHDSDCTLGLGLSSITSLPNCYGQNTRDQQAYLDAIAAGRLPYQRGVGLSADDQLRREVIQQLACRLKVDIPAIEKKYGIDFQHYFSDSLDALRQAQCDSLVSLESGQLQVTERGRLVLRNICALFDASIAVADDLSGRHSDSI